MTDVATWLKNNGFHEFVKDFEGNRFEWIVFFFSFARCGYVDFTCLNTSVPCIIEFSFDQTDSDVDGSMMLNLAKDIHLNRLTAIQFLAPNVKNRSRICLLSMRVAEDMKVSKHNKAALRALQMFLNSCLKILRVAAQITALVMR